MDDSQYLPDSEAFPGTVTLSNFYSPVSTVSLVIENFPQFAVR